MSAQFKEQKYELYGFKLSSRDDISGHRNQFPIGE